MPFASLATPPCTPITSRETHRSSQSQSDISSLRQLEQRIAALELQNATLITQVQTLCNAPSVSDPIASTTPTFSPPSTPGPTTSAFGESQSSTDRRCFALAKRVEALQHQLNQCVDACSSALELERNIRTDVELENERLADEIRVLKVDKDSLQRQVRRYKRLAQPPVLSEEDEEDEEDEFFDESPIPRTRKRADLRISTCSNASTLVDEVQSPPLAKRSSFRGSWYLAARKARSMVSLDLSSFAESLAELEQPADPEPDEPQESTPAPVTAPKLSAAAKISSDVMKKAAHRASTLFSDVVRTYGDLSVVEGVVL